MERSVPPPKNVACGSGLRLLCLALMNRSTRRAGGRLHHAEQGVLVLIVVMNVLNLLLFLGLPARRLARPRSSSLAALRAAGAAQPGVATCQCLPLARRLVAPRANLRPLSRGRGAFRRHDSRNPCGPDDATVASRPSSGYSPRLSHTAERPSHPHAVFATTLLFALFQSSRRLWARALGPACSWASCSASCVWATAASGPA